MNRKQVLEAINAGRFLAIGEYRMSKAEVIKWSDKQTGEAKEGPSYRHTVEFGSTSVSVNERVDSAKLKGAELEKFTAALVPPFRKGQLVVLELTEYTTTKGLVSCRGRLLPLEDGTSPALSQPLGSDAKGKQ